MEFTVTNFTFDDIDPAIQYSGDWLSQSGSSADFGNTLSLTDDVHARFTIDIQLNITSFYYFAPWSSSDNGGLYAICIDCDIINPQWVKIDGVNSDGDDDQDTPSVVLFSTTWETAEGHSIVVANQRDSRSGGASQMALDKLVVGVASADKVISTTSSESTVTSVTPTSTVNTLPKISSTSESNSQTTHDVLSSIAVVTTIQTLGSSNAASSISSQSTSSNPEAATAVSTLNGEKPKNSLTKIVVPVMVGVIVIAVLFGFLVLRWRRRRTLPRAYQLPTRSGHRASLTGGVENGGRYLSPWAPSPETKGQFLSMTSESTESFGLGSNESQYGSSFQPRRENDGGAIPLLDSGSGTGATLPPDYVDAVRNRQPA